MLRGEGEGDGDTGDELPLLQAELCRECRGEDGRERGEGGVFMSPSRASKAIARVRKFEHVMASRVRA
jgi:hypothetical protein